MQIGWKSTQVLNLHHNQTVHCKLQVWILDGLNEKIVILKLHV